MILNEINYAFNFVDDYSSMSLEAKRNEAEVKAVKGKGLRMLATKQML